MHGISINSSLEIDLYHYEKIIFEDNKDKDKDKVKDSVIYYDDIINWFLWLFVN